MEVPIVILLCLIGLLVILLIRKEVRPLFSSSKASAPKESSPVSDQGNKVAEVSGSIGVHIDQRTQWLLDTAKPKVQTIKDWGRGERSFRDPFFSNERLESYMQSIRENIKSNNFSKSTRILGLSGLGKTRLVFECLSQCTDYDGDIYYCDVSFQVDEVVIFLKKEIERKGKICFVVDSCELRLHNLLAEEIRRTGQEVHLITIDKEVGQRVSQGRGIQIIELVPKDYEETVIRELVTHYYPNLPKPDIDKIAAFSQGFPLIAKQLAYARDLGDDNIGELSDDDLLRKLIGVDEKDDIDAYHVLRTCSIFEKIGYSYDLAGQKDFVANTSAISRLTSAENIKLFENKCSVFLKRGILEKQGRYITVRPKPLAIRLAADWWRDCIARGDAFDIIQQITEQGLGEDLCSQIAKLDFLPEAKKLTEELCGPQAPFGRAGVLNTTEGSRLFRSLAEVNPQIAAETLFYHYGNASLDELKAVDEGRRYLVWTLEKLCFREDTFEKAATVLLSFAAAENEHISNNASGQFVQLFQVILPGTSASLEQRLKIFKIAIGKEQPVYKELAVSAAGRALSTFRGTSRMTGAEDFGSSPRLEDYRPKENEEVEAYYTSILGFLEHLSCSNDAFSSKAKKIIGTSIGSLFGNGFGTVAIRSVDKILKCDDVFWEDAFLAAIHLYGYSEGRFSDEAREEILALIKKLEPQNFKDRYQAIVSTQVSWDFGSDRPWSELRKEGVNYRDLSRRNVRYLINDSIDKLNDLDLTFLFRQRHPEAVIFGEELGEVILDSEEYDYGHFLQKMITSALSRGTEQNDVSVLAGYVKSDPDKGRQTEMLEGLLNNNFPLSDFLNIARFCSPSLERILSWIDIYKGRGDSLQPFRVFAYGRALEHLPIAEILRIGEKIIENEEKGAYLALDIISSYVKIGGENWEGAKSKLKEIISEEGVISGMENAHRFIAMDLRDYINEFLREGEEAFLNKVKGEVVKHISENKRLGFNTEFEILLVKLIREHFSIIWPDLSQLLLNNAHFYMMAKFHLGVSEGANYTDGILFSNSDNYPLILDWCRSNSPEAPRLIASMMPTGELAEGGKIVWNQLAKKLIDDFGADKNFLNQISANTGSYSSVGSSIPYLRSKKELFDQLKDHPISEVREWAVSQSRLFSDSLKLERLRDEEWGFS